MPQIERRTVVTPDRLAMRTHRLAAARSHGHGLQTLTFDQLAARMAGGLSRPVDDDALRSAVQEALPLTGLGELESIKSLPGMTSAAVDTLKKAWRAGLDLQADRERHPRLAALAALEAAVLDRLPPGMVRTGDLAGAACDRSRFAPKVLGPIDVVGITELAPCWRALLEALSKETPVRWLAGPRSTPAWLDTLPIEIVRSAPTAPEVIAVSAATAYHEAVEALRWARKLITSGRAAPADIAIAAVTPGDYDDHFLALRADANLDLHFVHGVPVAATRDGQAAAALADILARGLSQTRLRRLAAHLSTDFGPFGALPDGWARILPPSAPLATAAAWRRFLARLNASTWPDGVDHTAELERLVVSLQRGAEGAGEIGEALLEGRALAIWRKALLAGPAASLSLTIEAMKVDDGLEAAITLAWMPASAAAATPRPFVRLLGLNSSRWPRRLAEDRLIPEHVLAGEMLDPLPAAAADRRDFETLLRVTERQVILSRARRDSDGRLLGRSPLLEMWPDEVHLGRNRTPEHAFSEADRLSARPAEFAATDEARSADAAWRDWRRDALTPHDGVVRAGHPVLQALADRVQSASSLRLLLRNPLGFLFRYGLHLAAPESGQDPLMVDALALGELVHQSLDLALRALEADGGLAAASHERILTAVREAVDQTAATWEAERATPPRAIWRRSLADVRELAARALTFEEGQAAAGASFSEVPFGGADARSGLAMPWDASRRVEIPGAGLGIAGYIDRLDIFDEGRRTRVRDYKTGRLLKEDVVINGGKELQRCLYAFAVRALLGDDVEVEASLLFLKDGIERPLADPGAVLEAVTGHLAAARAALLSGAATVGPDTAGLYDDLAFALPANAAAGYAPRKLPAATERLGDAALVWSAA